MPLEKTRSSRKQVVSLDTTKARQFSSVKQKQVAFRTKSTVQQCSPVDALLDEILSVDLVATHRSCDTNPFYQDYGAATPPDAATSTDPFSPYRKADLFSRHTVDCEVPAVFSSNREAEDPPGSKPASIVLGTSSSRSSCVLPSPVFRLSSLHPTVDPSSATFRPCSPSSRSSTSDFSFCSTTSTSNIPSSLHSAVTGQLSLSEPWPRSVLHKPTSPHLSNLETPLISPKRPSFSPASSPNLRPSVPDYRPSPLSSFSPGPTSIHTPLMWRLGGERQIRGKAIPIRGKDRFEKADTANTDMSINYQSTHKPKERLAKSRKKAKEMQRRRNEATAIQEGPFANEKNERTPEVKRAPRRGIITPKEEQTESLKRGKGRPKSLCSGVKLGVTKTLNDVERALLVEGPARPDKKRCREEQGEGEEPPKTTRAGIRAGTIRVRSRASDYY